MVSFFLENDNNLFFQGGENFKVKHYQGYGKKLNGVGELKAAAGVKKADNVIDGMRVIDKVSDGSNFRVYLEFTEADRIKQLNLSNCRSIMKSELTTYRNKLIEDGHKNISKICSVIDAGNTSIRGKGGSGIWMYNPTIKDYRNINPKDFCRTPNDYTKYYRELLSDDYIRSLPDECFVKTSKVQVREEMSKLRHNINEVKKAAIKDPDIHLNMFGEASFEYQWNVENCAEIWAARDAIFKGAKFDDLVVRTEKLKGGFAEPCNNCLRTFFDFYNIDH